ncbi:MAG: hypothetical protein ACOVT5_12330, partial [Armatimonadaceae bacterium]
EWWECCPDWRRLANQVPKVAFWELGACQEYPFRGQSGYGDDERALVARACGMATPVAFAACPSQIDRATLAGASAVYTA